MREKAVFFLPVNILTGGAPAFLATRHTTVCLDTPNLNLFRKIYSLNLLVFYSIYMDMCYKILNHILDTLSLTILTDPTISVIHKEVLQKLSLIPVQIKHNTFIQQLAMKLPHWQSTAKLLGLSEVDIQEIEVDYCTGQRQDGSFPPIFRGEQAYQALRRWTESKGHYATYADLLVALYNATLSNEHTTDAWWYAYHELTLCSHYFNAT